MWSILANIIFPVTKQKFTALILDEASQYIRTINNTDQGTVRANINAMEQGEFDVVKTKQLRDKVRKLIVGNHHITYFLLNNCLYFVRGFRKKALRHL